MNEIKYRYHKDITVNATMFIVPNPAGIVGKLKQFKEALAEFAELNEIQFDPDKDRCVEVWMYNELDHDSDNFNSIGFTVSDNGVTYQCTAKSGLCGFLPASLLEGKKEGDVIQITIPGYYRIHGSVSSPVLFSFNVKLQQHESRYARFGNFEDAFEYVTK